MDDCSPDATPDIVAGITDPRVRHVRHATNVGHLRNYNIGIAMARGDYIWLISADDRLRRPYVVERFVEQLDRHPRVGYVFCPVIRFDGERETTLYGSHGDRAPLPILRLRAAGLRYRWEAERAAQEEARRRGWERAA